MKTCILRLMAIGTGMLLCFSASADKVIIRCPKPYDDVVKQIQDAGGRVSFQYGYVDAIAADVGEPTLTALRTRLGPRAVTKDLLASVPVAPRDSRLGELKGHARSASATSLAPGQLSGPGRMIPSDYMINNTALNLGPVFDAGFLGKDVKVAIIDSGLRPGFPHLAGSVIGGEDLVGDELTYLNLANNPHGTFVAGMIAAHVIFDFTADSPFLQAVQANCPSCVVNGTQIPMIGSAPLASVYALRVFAPEGGAPFSVIMAAMERVIELRENYNQGGSEAPDAEGKCNALNIRVCNMSLGGPTVYAAQDLADQLTQMMLDHDIVLCIAAGNDGPTGMTVGSPGTGCGALTVGASCSPTHMRIALDAFVGPGFGGLVYPFEGTQTAFFSSRGPTADGRTDPDVVANGVCSFSQGFGNPPNDVSIGDGTSFATPTVAGVAAVLRQAVPGATAHQVRNALMMSANPNLLSDGSGPLDQGHGHADAAAAVALLRSGGAPDTPGAVGLNNVNMSVNILQGAGVKTYAGNVTRTATGLKPGQRFEIFYRVEPNTSAIIVTLSDFKAGSVQNLLWGDDILLTVHSVKPTASQDYYIFTPTTGGQFTVPKPEAGVLRITLNGDWTNAGEVGATMNIVSITDAIPGFSTQGQIANGDWLQIPFTVPAGTAKLNARLVFSGDWGSYPANDVDLYLVDPDWNLNWDGATIDDPELANTSAPEAGNWLALINGYTVNTKNAALYQLRLEADGKVLRAGKAEPWQ